LRGEITGAIAAFKFGLSRGAPFSIWTDNALVHKRIKEYATQGKAVLNGKRNDHDLWMTLQGLVCRACSRGLFQFVVKVTSHQEESQLDVVEEWAREGNECADRLAAMAQHQLPSQVRLLQGKLIYQHNRRHFACKHFHAMLVQFGLRCVEGKATVAHEDANRWADAKKLQEEEESQISLKGFTTDLVAPPSQRLGVCVQPLQQWLTQLLGQDDATPLWLSSYQLYAHYRMTTGHIGFYYDAASRKWDTAEGFVHEHGFNFLKMASWLQAITKEYAKLCELNCSALQCRSSHGAVRSRPTSDASSFRHHLVRLHWWTKLSVV
jgi:ribonuclease HI